MFDQTLGKGRNQKACQKEEFCLEKKGVGLSQK